VEQRLSLFARAVVLLFASLLFVPTARADTSADRHFKNGSTLYEKGKFREAALAFEKAFDRNKDSQSLFAWAQTEKLAGNCKRANRLYRKLLDHEELAHGQRGAVEEVVAECVDIIAAAASAEQPTATKHPEQPQQNPQLSKAEAGPSWYADPVGMVLLGSGIVMLGAGTGLLIAADSKDSQADGAGNYGEFDDRLGTARTRTRLGIVALVGGGLLCGSSAAWYLLRKESEPSSVASAWATTDGFGVSYTLRH
jgi:tetratricopeptide (TPR) repeat protein